MYSRCLAMFGTSYGCLDFDVVFFWRVYVVPFFQFGKDWVSQFLKHRNWASHLSYDFLATLMMEPIALRIHRWHVQIHSSYLTRICLTCRRFREKGAKDYCFETFLLEAVLIDRIEPGWSSSSCFLIRVTMVTMDFSHTAFPYKDRDRNPIRLILRSD